jgi:hypothetical protein
MKSIYEAKTHEELREAVVQLCVETATRWHSSLGNRESPLASALYIVPPVPKVLREVESTVTKGLKFRCKDGVVQAKHDSYSYSIAWVNSLSVTIADVDIIADLKANPYVTTKSACDCDMHAFQVCYVCQATVQVH